MSGHITATRPHFQPLDPSPRNVNFLAKIAADVLIAESGCWEWQGCKSKDGYGITYRNRIQCRVHRVVYDLCVVAVPQGINVCHNCPNGDNPACCNPAHLFLGTQKENIHDAMLKGRFRPRKASGSENPQAKLTEDDVREIRRKARNGIRQTELQAEYGISRASVHRIVSGLVWAHVKDQEPIMTLWGNIYCDGA